jgi:hypothetical protein
MPVLAVVHQLPAARLDPIKAFEARCQAKALLVYACEIDLHDGVDALQMSAVENGLVRQIGQDAVQQIMADAFATIRKLEDPPC